ncbi:MauE/DoxX family redox-associated membrane protein [Hydrocarboniphaga effusa]|uniref:MauE/DoxX family redox-associated membrane protein n=1 Tax=Hydrocarboniphaga effusa TaxID=243629 RepID=UPI00398C0BAE
MVMDKHICPFGLKSLDLLKRKGYAVEDHHLTSKEATEAFKREHAVDTTPQTFIDGRRIGGYDDVRRYFGKRVAEPGAVSYQPVIVLFAISALMALAAAWVASGDALSARTFEWFIAFSMCALAMQKLRDVEAFSTMFLGYDLLARRWVPYARLYPFGEALAGVLMIAGIGAWIAIPIATVIGSIGAASVFYAVYIQRRELRCACVGGDSNVPLGFVSLTENLMMIIAAAWWGMRLLHR